MDTDIAESSGSISWGVRTLASWNARRKFAMWVAGLVIRLAVHVSNGFVWDGKVTSRANLHPLVAPIHDLPVLQTVSPLSVEIGSEKCALTSSCM